MRDVRGRQISFESICAEIEEPLRGFQPPLLVRQFLKMMQDAGIFLEHDDGIYEFAHFSFCEYLAAGYARCRSQDETLLSGVADPWWRQTLLFYAGIIPNASAVLERCLASEDPSRAELTLALACLDEAKSVDPAVRERVGIDPQAVALKATMRSGRKRRRKLLLTLRIARMERRGQIFTDHAPIAAFEYQLRSGAYPVTCTTCTETCMDSNAFASPDQLPESGEALSCSRATATEICSLPARLLLVGSKPCQPAPGM